MRDVRALVRAGEHIISWESRKSEFRARRRADNVLEFVSVFFFVYVVAAAAAVTYDNDCMPMEVGHTHTQI